MWGDHRETSLVCQKCGAAFVSPMGDALYCSRKCAMAARRRAGVYADTSQCIVCGNEFRYLYKYRPPRTCSRSCGQKLRWSDKLSE